MSLDCDWSISLHESVTTGRKSVATVQKSVTKKSDWLKTQKNLNEPITANNF